MLALVADGFSAAMRAISVFRFCSEAMNCTAAMHAIFVCLLTAQQQCMQLRCLMSAYECSAVMHASLYVCVCERVRFAFVTVASV